MSPDLLCEAFDTTPHRWSMAMGQWGNATEHGAWRQSGWKRGGWAQTQRDEAKRAARGSGRWTSADVAVTVIAFMARWELGLAFLALKLWHQASGEPGSTFAFARRKWDGLVDVTRGLLSGTTLPFSLHFGAKDAAQSSGNQAFDLWRRGEIERIDAERDRLRMAERDFAAYRSDLLHAKDREDFDRFMNSRT